MTDRGAARATRTADPAAAGHAAGVGAGPRARAPTRRRTTAPDVVGPPTAEPDGAESQHDRWLREQRPPHWE